MGNAEYERQEIVDYMYMSAPNETVEHLEKVASENVLGRKIDIWNVHTNVRRWWVMSSPINLYSDEQSQEKPEGDCVFVEVPLRGPNPPIPSKKRSK